MIADVDETLRRLLTAELPERNPLWRANPVRITFDPPAVAERGSETDTGHKGAGPRAPWVNIYLHDVRENTALRADETPMRIRPGLGGENQSGNSGKTMVGLRRPGVKLDLSYLVTAHAFAPEGGEGKNEAKQDVGTEHRLLADVLAVFLRTPVLPANYLAGVLTDPEENGQVPLLPLAVAQPEHPALREPNALWSALGGRLRPTIGVTLVATFNPFETKWTRLVREAVVGFGQGTPQAGNGPARPLDLRTVRVSAAGVVTDAAAAGSMAETTISVFHDAQRVDEPLATTTTDERGFFSFLNLPPGVRRLRVEKRGWVRVERDITVPPPGRPDLLETLVIALEPAEDEASETTEAARLAALWDRRGGGNRGAALVETDRQRRVTLSGTLRYPDGRPASYIPVSVETAVETGTTPTRRKTTTTDGHGFYCFFDVAEADAAHARLVAEVPGVGEVPLASAENRREPARVQKGAKMLEAVAAEKRNGQIIPLPGSSLPAKNGG